MSHYFVKKFNKEHKCSKCKSSKLQVGKKIFSLCQDHLIKAKERWRVWQIQRRVEGKCSYCDKKSYNGWIRCKTHALYNREKCKQWYKVNKEYYKMYNLGRKAEWLSQSKCPQCKEHRSLTEGYARCSVCRVKRKSGNSFVGITL